MALFGKRVSMLEVQNRALIKMARERAERAVLVIAIIWIGWLYCLKPVTAVRLTNGRNKPSTPGSTTAAGMNTLNANSSSPISPV